MTYECEYYARSHRNGRKRQASLEKSASQTIFCFNMENFLFIVCISFQNGKNAYFLSHSLSSLFFSWTRHGELWIVCTWVKVATGNAFTEGAAKVQKRFDEVYFSFTAENRKGKYLFSCTRSSCPHSFSSLLSP